MRKRKKKAKRGTCLSSYLSPIAPGSSSYTRAAQELFVKLRDSEEIQKVASNWGGHERQKEPRFGVEELGGPPFPCCQLYLPPFPRPLTKEQVLSLLPPLESREQTDLRGRLLMSNSSFLESLAGSVSGRVVKKRTLGQDLDCLGLLRVRVE